LNHPFTPLGRTEIEALISHRPPILLVDEVTAFYAAPRCELRANYLVTPDHVVLAGHFPNQPVWPGVLTIEGMAQAANLLAVLLGRLQAGEAAQQQGWLAAVEVKLLHPVRPGDRLDYAVRLRSTHANVQRIDVSAGVGRREVAHGSIAVATHESAVADHR
jgi:3-hydroxyacyl-[acyl-carrier-protein] dehydratase